MCQVAIHNVHRRPLAHMIINRDPTRTTVLRNTFVADMNRRFKELARAIIQSVVEEDVFGLRNEVTVTILQVTTPGRRAFAFNTNTQKVSAFMDWINRQINAGILDVREITQVGQSVNAAWSNKYIFDSYERGVARARTQLIQQGYSVPRLSETGGIAASMATPIHLDRVGLLYTRAFNELRGITSAMETQMSRYLSQGLVNGWGPSQIARALNAAVIGGGADLGLEIAYVNPRTGNQVNYFMPGRRRAEILARTETIRAHAHGTLQEYQNWGVVGVHVEAELITAGDDRVCEQCANLEGTTFAIKDAWQVIPVHAQCRCAWIPTGAKETPEQSKWENINDPGELSQQLKNKAHVRIPPDQLRTASARKSANAIGQSMADDVWGKLPDLNAIDAGNNLKKVADAVRAHLGGDLSAISGREVSKEALAMFMDSLEIAINTNKVKSLKTVLELGSKNWHIGTDMASTFRHEYGHWLYELGGGGTRSAGTGAKQQALRAWNKFYQGKYKWDARTKSWIEDTVWDAKPGSHIFAEDISHYAGTNANEAFAESFSAYTSPLYGKGGKRLPKQIEKLLEDIIGKRPDL